MLLRVEPEYDLHDTIVEAQNLANRILVTVVFTMNGIQLSITPDEYSTLEASVEYYTDQYNKQIALRTTPGRFEAAMERAKN